MRDGRMLPFFQLWLAGTLVFLLGTGLVFRPDRDAAQYWQHRSVSAQPSDVTERQLLARIRLLQNQGLSQEQIEIELLSHGTLSRSVLSEKIELSTALRAGEHAKRRLTSFLVTGLIPPLIALELGLLLVLMRRGSRSWRLMRLN